MRSGRNSQRNIRNRSFTAHGLDRYLTIKNDSKTSCGKIECGFHCHVFIPLSATRISALCESVGSLSLNCKWPAQTTMRKAQMWHGQGFQVVAHGFVRVWSPNTAKAIMRSTCGTIHEDLPLSFKKKIIKLRKYGRPKTIRYKQNYKIIKKSVAC